MNTISNQTEAIIEEKLIKQLISLWYEKVKISNEQELISNLKKQLEIFNYQSLQKAGISSFSEKEFKQITNFLKDGSIVQKAEKLRDSFLVNLDNWEKCRVRFINQEQDKWCKNEFQVTSQISQTNENNKKNRYDVTILINWLPLTQIELKNKWVAIKESFNQFLRYQKQSFGSGIQLFQYAQILISSNSVNTQYYANNEINKLNLKQRFTWTDFYNNKVNELSKFTEQFLEPCRLARTIVEDIIVSKTNNMLMILRSYQHFAYKAIIDKVNNFHINNLYANKVEQNGYIWHSTGSWKTLTSFITSKNLRKNNKLRKVFFVVDRKDLDTQTQDEFNNFESGSANATTSTKTLFQKIKSNKDNDKLIITTIQKLDRILSNDKYRKELEELWINDERVAFIFDECHRSQFWKTHREIKKFFTKHQLFWFTGTPIFDENSNSWINTVNTTTADLFGERLHTYNIKNAIADQNVLRFAVEYFNTVKLKTYSETKTELIEEEILNTKEKELLEDNTRINNISDFILKDFPKKSQKDKSWNFKFNAMFATSNIPVALKYYNSLKSKNNSLKIAIIYSVGNPNQDKLDFSTQENIDIDNSYTNTSIELQKAADEYSETFGIGKFDVTNQESYEMYRKDIARRMKKKEVEWLDLLIVVDMFLTWFDSPYINTIYVDKFLKYHLLLQAFSRTNRLYDETKTQWNVVCFRNLIKNVNDAVVLFSKTDQDKYLNDENSIVLEWFQTYIDNVNQNVKKLRDIAPTPQDVDKLEKESDIKEFIITYKELAWNLVRATQFIDYEDVFVDLAMPEEYIEYKTKYLDLCDRIKENKIDNLDENENSELQEIDFNLDLFQTDIINVDYIYELLERYLNEEVETNEKKNEKAEKDIAKQIDSIPSLRWIKDSIMKYVKDRKEDKEKFDLDGLKSHLKNSMINDIKIFALSEDIFEDKLLSLFYDYSYIKNLSDKWQEIDSLYKKALRPIEKKKKRDNVRKFLENLDNKYWEHI